MNIGKNALPKPEGQRYTDKRQDACSTIFERDGIMKKTLTGLIIVTICGAALAGCGRKGPLEPPPSSMIENADGKKVEKPKENKPFILDGLIKQRH